MRDLNARVGKDLIPNIVGSYGENVYKETEIDIYV